MGNVAVSNFGISYVWEEGVVEGQHVPKNMIWEVDPDFSTNLTCILAS